MVSTWMSWLDNARTTASRPKPTPLTNTSALLKPYCCFAACAAFSVATCAAYAVPFLEPRNPQAPALELVRAPPLGSVNVMIVLLKEACTCTCPWATVRFAFFRLVVVTSAMGILCLRWRLLRRAAHRYFLAAPCACICPGPLAA